MPPRASNLKVFNGTGTGTGNPPKILVSGCSINKLVLNLPSGIELSTVSVVNTIIPETNIALRHELIGKLNRQGITKISPQKLGEAFDPKVDYTPEAFTEGLISAGQNVEEIVFTEPMEITAHPEPVAQPITGGDPAILKPEKAFDQNARVRLLDLPDQIIDVKEDSAPNVIPLNASNKPPKKENVVVIGNSFVSHSMPQSNPLPKEQNIKTNVKQPASDHLDPVIVKMVKYAISNNDTPALRSVIEEHPQEAEKALIAFGTHSIEPILALIQESTDDERVKQAEQAKPAELAQQDKLAKPAKLTEPAKLAQQDKPANLTLPNKQITIDRSWAIKIIKAIIKAHGLNAQSLAMIKNILLACLGQTEITDEIIQEILALINAALLDIASEAKPVEIREQAASEIVVLMRAFRSKDMTAYIKQFGGTSKLLAQQKIRQAIMAFIRATSLAPELTLFLQAFNDYLAEINSPDLATKKPSDVGIKETQAFKLASLNLNLKDALENRDIANATQLIIAIKNISIKANVNFSHEIIIYLPGFAGANITDKEKDDAFERIRIGLGQVKISADSNLHIVQASNETEFLAA